MSDLERQIQAYVAFVPLGLNSIPPGTSRWLDAWSAIADPEFYHVTVFAKVQGLDIYSELHVYHSFLAVELFTSDFVEEFIGKSQYSKVLYCDRKVDLRSYRPHLTLTCVSAVKHALGIWAPMVLTPRQLYRYLIRLPEFREINQDGKAPLNPEEVSA